MRASSGQKTQRPGQGKGRVSTVTGVTPDRLRTGRRRSRSTKAASSRCAGAGAGSREDLAAGEEPATVLGMPLEDAVEPARVEPGLGGDRLDDRGELALVGAGSNSLRCRTLGPVCIARLGGRYANARTMDPETASALAAINREFYRDEAQAFSRTREEPWPGWLRVSACLEPGAEPLEVLDVGCGNGRFAAFLETQLGERAASLRYTGLDASEALLEHARARSLASGPPRLHCADVVLSPPEDALPPGPFALIVLFGLLHHVPGESRTPRVARGRRPPARAGRRAGLDGVGVRGAPPLPGTGGPVGGLQPRRAASHRPGPPGAGRPSPALGRARSRARALLPLRGRGGERAARRRARAGANRGLPRGRSRGGTSTATSCCARGLERP